jgi:hypothetical protein
VELYKKVRLACAEGMSARAAAQHFNISRGTVDKMLAFSVPPGYRREKPITRPKLDRFTEIIDAWLEADKVIHRKQRPHGEADMGTASGRAWLHRRLYDHQGLRACDAARVDACGSSLAACAEQSPMRAFGLVKE